MQDFDLEALAKKYLNNEATAEEIERLLKWYEDFDNDLVVTIEDPAVGSHENLKQRMLQQLHRTLEFSSDTEPAHRAKMRVVSRKYMIRSLSAAAAVILIFFALKALWPDPVKENQDGIAFGAAQPDSILPGSSRAVLTLSDGMKIALDTSGNGLIASEGRTEAHQTGKGQLTYLLKSDSDITRGLNTFNTVTTPMGGQYELVLSDGTKIWLNAGSSIMFPTVFSETRKIWVTGEVYLEVAARYTDDRQKKLPFIVTVNPSGQEIEVLGTAFNINAYPDEHVVATTLLEGVIKVHPQANPATTQVLNPGQQLLVKHSAAGSNEIRNLKEAELENIVAWKNKMFRFGNSDLTGIMRQVARWYNVEVVYDEKFETQFFSGSIPRHSNVREVLHKLELTRTVSFQIDGRKILVKNVKQ